MATTNPPISSLFASPEWHDFKKALGKCAFAFAVWARLLPVKKLAVVVAIGYTYFGLRALSVFLEHLRFGFHLSFSSYTIFSLAFIAGCAYVVVRTVRFIFPSHPKHE